MGRSGKIGYDQLSNYFGLPNRKRKLLTKEFLIDFRDELIKRDKEYNIQKGNYEETDYSKETYISFYGQVEGSYLFYNALEEVCRKHNVTKAIYDYAQNMPWFDSDYFDDDLVLEMVSKGVIEYDNEFSNTNHIEDELMTAEYKLIKRCKGYNIVEHGYWYNDCRESLEEIYEDINDGWELYWLN